MAYTTIDDPSAYFQIATYTGTGSSQSITNDGNSDMQPDWVWWKSRGATQDYQLYDVVRGVTKAIETNKTTAEYTQANGLTSFNSDGFTVGGGTAGNADGDTFVAWNWKAGTSFSNDQSSTSVGSLDSSGSTSTTAGFSIVKIDGLPAGTTSTFAHNLGVKPDFIIFKSRNLTTNWDVYHSSALPDGERKLYLNDTDAVIDSGFMTDTPPTSSVVSFNPGSNDSNHIAYCFAQKQGYSKFGNYFGNGNANGRFIFTGFKPALIMLKRTDTGNNWHLADNKRLNPYNVTSAQMYPNLANAEAEQADLDILSNGFKPRQAHAFMNASGGAYIYMAFAENPFVTSSGVPATAR